MTEVHDPDPGERSVVTGERRGGCRARFTERANTSSVCSPITGAGRPDRAFAIDLEETGRQHHRAAIGLDMVEAAPSLKCGFTSTSSGLRIGVQTMPRF